MRPYEMLMRRTRGARVHGYAPLPGTSVMLDVLVPGAPHAEASEQALTESLRFGTLIVSEAAYAEPAARFSAQDEVDGFLVATGIRLQPSGVRALYLAGRAWREYARQRPDAPVCPACGTSQETHCARCGTALHPRQHVLADFLIGGPTP